MTITLNDEQARLLFEVVNAGIARSPEEAWIGRARAPFINDRQETRSSAGGQLGGPVREVALPRP